MKLNTILIFIIILHVVFISTNAQIYYNQSSGKVTVSPNSILLPTSTVTSNGVTTNNPGSTPIVTNTAFGDQVNSIFQPLNRSVVTTGLLRDYGIDFTDIGRYNGVRTTTNYMIAEEWPALYLTLYSYRFTESAALLHPQQVDERTVNYGIQSNGGSNVLSRIAYAASNPVVHHITGLHYQYQQFKANAVSSNLVYISNSQIYDTPGRSSSPYETKDAFAFSLPHTDLDGTDHKFIFRSDLFFTNTGKTINTLQADFADGLGYRTVSFNTVMNVYYSTNGVKTVLFKMTYTDGSIFESHARVEVSGISSAQQNPLARYKGIDTSRLFFPKAGFPSPRTFENQFGKALVTVEYAQGNGHVIRKPFIFVEGFDSWRITSPDNPDANRSFEKFITTSDFGLIPIQSGKTLSDLLESNGYDLIYIDFEDGTDYIQRNAYLVQNVIEWVNSVKQPYNGVRQQNVVVGASMGGLVGKYALKDMENRGINHEARLFCAFDSPHQGANVPLAIQAAASHLASVGIGFGLPGIYFSPGSFTLGNLKPKIGRLSILFTTPAVKQMAKYRVYDLPGDFGFMYDNSTHDQFMSEYSGLGYPVNSRNIFISNGSECGVNQGFQPYAELMHVDSVLSLPGWVKFAAKILSPRALFTTYPQLSLLSLPGTKMDVKAEFILNTLPDQQQQRIYKGNIYVKKKILGLINLNITLSNRSLYSNSSFLPLDSAPGGVFDIDLLAKDLPFVLLQKRFSFVPTYSALDISGGTQPINSSDLSRAYSPGSPPPFPKNVRVNNFLTGSKISTSPTFANENHVQITQRNGSWLFQEIQGTTAFSSCLYLCSGSTGATISGSSVVCGNNSNFVLNNVPVGATITWTNSTNLSYVSGQGTTSYFVSKNNSGTGYVSASVTTECGTFAVPQFNVHVGGYSSSDYPVTGPGSACRNENVYYNTNELPDAISHAWFWPSDWTYVSGQGTRYLALNTGNSSYGGAVGVRVSNACDAGGSPATMFTSVSSCGSYSAFAVYPNPGADEITVSLDDFDSLGNKKAKLIKQKRNEFEVSLFDKSRTKMVTMSSKDETLSIPVRSLPEGFYYLNILHKEGILQRQILIKRN